MTTTPIVEIAVTAKAHRYTETHASTTPAGMSISTVRHSIAGRG